MIKLTRTIIHAACYNMSSPEPASPGGQTIDFSRTAKAQPAQIAFKLSNFGGSHSPRNDAQPAPQKHQAQPSGNRLTASPRPSRAASSDAPRHHHSVHYQWWTLSRSFTPRQGGQAGRLQCFKRVGRTIWRRWSGYHRLVVGLPVRRAVAGGYRLGHPSPLNPWIRRVNPAR